MCEAHSKKLIPPKLPDLSVIAIGCCPVVKRQGTPGAISGSTSQALMFSAVTAAPDVSPPATTIGANFRFTSSLANSPKKRSIAFMLINSYACAFNLVKERNDFTALPVIVRHYLNAIINTSHCTRGDLSCGIMCGALRSMPSNS